MLNPADVTTLIPVYNTDPKYLDRSINSILNCGYNLILIDDHSDNEDTIDLLYGNYNKYVIKSKSIQSQSGALYTGAELINTKYAMTIDSDDYITGSVDPQSDEEFDVCFTNGFKYTWTHVKSFEGYLRSAGPIAWAIILKTELAKSLWDRPYTLDINNDVLFGFRLWHKIEKFNLIHTISKIPVYIYNQHSSPIRKSLSNLKDKFTPLHNVPFMIAQFIEYEQLSMDEVRKVVFTYQKYYKTIRVRSK